MRFPMDRPVKVVMLGAGGTGGYVAPYLFRLLHMRLNRRVPVGTHGGVRGRLAIQRASYSIILR